MDNKEEENLNTGEEEQNQQQQQAQDPLAAPFSGGDERYRDRNLPKKNIIPGASALNTVTKGANKVNTGVGKLNTKVQGKNPNGTFAKGMNKTSSSINKGTNSLNAFNNRMQNINNAANRIGQVAEDPKAAAKDAISETAKQAVKKKIKLVFVALPLPVKIAILVAIGVFFFFLIIICAMSFEDIDTGSGEIGGYSYTINNTAYWWPIGSSTTTTSGGITMATDAPVASRINSGFGYRNTSVGSKNHKGIDIGNGWTKGVVNAIAAIDATVIQVYDVCHGSKYDSGCPNPRGNYVKTKNVDGNISIYQHLDSISVKEGEKVKQGQVLGKVGASGVGSGAHLHFEVWVNEVPVNPVTYVSVDNPRPMSENAKFVSSKKVDIPDNASTIQKACLVLKANGYTDDAVAGVIGNMQRESGVSVDPTIINYIKCVGIVQWCYSRKVNLQSTYGSAWSNMDNQLDFMLKEIQNMSELNQYMKTTHTPGEQADKFCYVFERPEAGECAKSYRRDYANSIYSYVQNGCK